jgi:hypothetical protein
MEADQTRGEAGLPCAVSAAKRKRDDEAEEVPQQHKAPKKKLSKRERRELRHKHQKALPLRPSDAADQAPVVVAAAAERDQPPYIIDSDKGFLFILKFNQYPILLILFILFFLLILTSQW